jgi:pimeloyl-ACP methyl ester carboxylesterase
VTSQRVPYDEFGLFHENAAEHGLPFDGPPTVRRQAAALPDGRTISALVWGDAPARYLFLHGGAQNAHTWDTVAMALAQPLVAVDLPGHGHSDAPADELSPWTNAADIDAALESLIDQAVHLVGMSLGGLTAIALIGRAPSRFRSLTLVDITPGVSSQRTQQITAFVNGPPAFASFDDLLARTIEFNPTRSESSLRRGILHNALQRDDGSWVWRYRRHAGNGPMPEPGERQRPDFGRLWTELSGVQVPVTLARGMLSQSVLGDNDEAEFVRRVPGAEVIHFDHAGHSIQGDMPVELAASLPR